MPRSSDTSWWTTFNQRGAAKSRCGRQLSFDIYELLAIYVCAWAWPESKLACLGIPVSSPESAEAQTKKCEITVGDFLPLLMALLGAVRGGSRSIPADLLGTWPDTC
jgi:hypothetical protein